MVHSMLNNDLRHYSTATAVSEVSIQVSERKQQQINKSISLSRSCTFKDAPLLSFKGGKEERTGCSDRLHRDTKALSVGRKKMR